MEKYLRNRKVKISFKRNIEPQEIFLDSLANKKEEELGVPEMKIETPLSRNVLRGFLFFALLINFLLLFRAFQMQVVQGSEYLNMAERNKFTFYQITAERGVIYDGRGQQLVFNKPSFDLALDTRKLPQEETEKTRVLKEVSSILQKNIKELQEEIKKNELPEILIAKNIPLETLIMLEARLNELPGFEIRNNTVRDYKITSGLSHLIGYTGKINREELRANPDVYSISDWVGRQGLEFSYEDVLKKKPGQLRVERDALGNLISQEVASLPESGNSVVLWLDFEFQKKLEETLFKQLQTLNVEKAAAVALDPKTGGVLAMVSLPGFDNNIFQKSSGEKELASLLSDPKNPLFNRVIAGKYLTGSTIKPLIALAALEEKIISPQKQIYSSGVLEVPHRYNPEIIYKFRDWNIHGWVDMRKAIAQSSNVYFYTIGGGFDDQKGLGPTKIKEHLELFGWGQGTGIDLPGEAKGFIPDVEWKRQTLGEGWWDGDTYFLSIGQGFLQITPLEVVSAFALIANGGKLLQPRVVKEILNSNKEVIEKVEPEIIRENFINPENLQVVREGMRQAVTGQNSPLASAVILNSLPVSSAAKTGTAELGQDRLHHWVTVFAPYENPEIVITIMIENIQGVQAATLPVAKEVLEWYFSRQNL